MVARLEEQHRERVGGLAVSGVRGAAVPLLGLRSAVLGGAEQPEVVRPVDVARVHGGPVPALGGLLLTAGGMQRAERVGGVAVAVLGSAQPPHGGALLVARVAQQEAQRAGGARLAVLGGGEVPASGLLELAALLQDRAEVQGGTPVTPGGGLAVPLLGLADPAGGGSRHGAVAVGRAPGSRGTHRPYAPGGCGRAAGKAEARSGSPGTGAPAQAEGVVRVLDGLPLQGAGQPVGGLTVPLFGGGAQPALGADVAAVLQQVGQRVRAQRVALLGGLAQPVLRAGLVAALAEVPAERVRGGGGAGHGGDAPPAGGLVRVAALVQQDAQVVRGGPVPVGGGGAQIPLGAVQLPPAQQQRAQDAHGRGVPRVGGAPVARLALGAVRGVDRVRGVLVGRAHRGTRVDGAGPLDRCARPGDGSGESRVYRAFSILAALLHKPPCLQQSCPVPHKYHRRTTCNPRTPGISRPVRSLQRFVDMPTGRQVKHVRKQLLPSEPHFTPTAWDRHGLHANRHDEGPDPLGSGPSSFQ
ncbi:hypothetical protein SPW_7510 [Streptomyces sp. W007]|nr:hypothetical protein SPW_7510 [Streptomyces sp. W007]